MYSLFIIGPIYKWRYYGLFYNSYFFLQNKLYVRIGRKKTEIYEVDKDNLEVSNIIRLDPGQPTPIEPKSAVFTDGNQLGLILLTNYVSSRVYLPQLCFEILRHSI